MRVLYTTPKQDGFYMPAEFSEHYGCILIFPERSDSWQYGAYAARKAFVKVCEAIAQSEKVTVCASDRQYENSRRISGWWRCPATTAGRGITPRLL